jgi:hypothetical protein
MLFETNDWSDLVDFGEVEAVRIAAAPWNFAVVAAPAVAYEILRLPVSDVR